MNYRNRVSLIGWRGVVCCVLFLIPVVFLSSPVYAQNKMGIKAVKFSDGVVVTGEILEMNINTIKIRTKGGDLVIRKTEDVRRIVDEKDAVALIEKPLLPVPLHAWHVGLEVSHITYKEPDVMKEWGMMYGLAFSYTYHQAVMVKLEAKLGYGEMDYENSGTMDNIPDNIVEVRGLIGYDFFVTPTFLITPYVGIGYRYLQDDSKNMVSSTGAKGYERESNYLYSPLGIEMTKFLEKGWSVGLRAEYDYFWQGKQESYLSGADPGYNDVINHQDHGYGVRGSIRVEKRGERIGFFAEPFIRYWNIKRSDDADLFYYGTKIGYGYEPKNHSTEIGCGVGVLF